jgi:hypothetical protein
MTEDTAARQDAPGRTGGSNGLAIAGFVCSLVGLLILSVILGPLGVIFGGVGLSRANKGARHRGLAIAAIVIGAIDLILGVVFIVTAAKHGGFVTYRFGR